MLEVSNKVVILFFHGVVIGLAAAVSVLWFSLRECQADRLRIWEEIHKLQAKP